MPLGRLGSLGACRYTLARSVPYSHTPSASGILLCGAHCSPHSQARDGDFLCGCSARIEVSRDTYSSKSASGKLAAGLSQPRRPRRGESCEIRSVASEALSHPPVNSSARHQGMDAESGRKWRQTLLEVLLATKSTCCGKRKFLRKARPWPVSMIRSYDSDTELHI